MMRLPFYLDFLLPFTSFSVLTSPPQGFDRGGPAPSFSPLSSYSMSLPSSLASPLPATSLPPAGFQPYRPSLGAHEATQDSNFYSFFWPVNDLYVIHKLVSC